MKTHLLIASLLLALTACGENQNNQQATYRNDDFGISSELATVKSVNIVPVDGAKYGLPPLPQTGTKETTDTSSTKSKNDKGVTTTTTTTTTTKHQNVYIKSYHYVVETDAGKTKNVIQDYSENLIPFAAGDRVRVQTKGVYEYTLLPLK